MAVKRRSNKPLGLVVLINIIAYVAGAFTCYWFVARYGGSMPPPGTFDDFISDTWYWITTGFLGPISATLLMSYLLRKRGRSTDAR
jgi:hypothetical protein